MKPVKTIRPCDQTNLVLSSTKKSKTWFFNFLNVYVSWMVIKYGIKFWSHRFHLQYSGILQARIDQRGEPMKMNFENFQIQKRISQTFRPQKVDKKIGSFVWFAFFVEIRSLNCPKYCMFGKSVLTSARHLNLLKQFIYIHLKDLDMLFQKIGCLIESWNIVPKKVMNKQKFSKNNSLTSNTDIYFVTHSIKTNTVFLKGETRTFKWIYINCYNSLTRATKPTNC